jgi:hypothetical protein
VIGDDGATGRAPLVLGRVFDNEGQRENHIAIWRGSAWISGPEDGRITRVYLPRR